MPAQVHASAIVDAAAEIGEGSEVMEFAVVRQGARIGRRCRIHPHVLIESGVEIADDVEVFAGSVIGKVPRGAAALAHEPTFVQSLRIGRGCCVGPNATVYYDVEIGEDSLVGDGASIREQARIGDRVVISRGVTLNYSVHVGDDSKVMDLTHLTGDTRIGQRVFVSAGVMSANDNAIGRAGFTGDVGPIIEDDAVIGLAAVLLPGVVVGRGATVAAAALVTRSVGEGVQVRGIPARPIEPQSSR